jgi:hypothetical protein
MLLNLSENSHLGQIAHFQDLPDSQLLPLPMSCLSAFASKYLMLFCADVCKLPYIDMHIDYFTF